MDISRRGFLQTALASGASCAVNPSRAASAAVKQNDDRPNVLWVVNDASRCHNYSCYGYKRSTSPNVDALAARGALFENAYSQAFYTAPSVASYMTSRIFPLSFPPQSYLYAEQTLLGDSDEVLVPVVFNNAGYNTVMISGNRAHVSAAHALGQLFRDAFDIPEDDVWKRLKKGGVSPYRKPSFRNANRIAFDWLNQWEQRERRAPFFMYLHTIETHERYFIPPEAPFNQWINEDYTGPFRYFGLARNHVDSFTVEDRRHLVGLYDGCIRFADFHFGNLLDRLDAMGQLDNTIVVFTSDHGEALYEDGKTAGHKSVNGGPDETRHVPLVMAGPGIPREKRCSDIVNLIDVAPTLYDLCNISIEGGMDGKSRTNDMLAMHGINKEDRYAITVHGSIFVQPVVRFVISNDEYNYDYRILYGEGDLRTAPALRKDWSEAVLPEETSADGLRHLAEKMLKGKLEGVHGNASHMALMLWLGHDSFWAKAKKSRVRIVRQAKPSFAGHGWHADCRNELRPELLYFPKLGQSTLPELLYDTRRFNYKGPRKLVLEMWAGAFGEENRFSGSKIHVDIGGAEGGRKEVELPDAELDEAGWHLVEVGVWNLNGIPLRLHLKPVADHAIRIRRAFILPLDPALELRIQALLSSELDEEDEELRLEAMEALGYLR